MDTAIDLTIHTKCPSKWLLIDLETGQSYRGLKNPNAYGKWQRTEKTINFSKESDILKGGKSSGI